MPWLFPFPNEDVRAVKPEMLYDFYPCSGRGIFIPRRWKRGLSAGEGGI